MSDVTEFDVTRERIVVSERRDDDDQGSASSSLGSIAKSNAADRRPMSSGSNGNGSLDSVAKDDET